jgi:hypothetical protein
MGLFCRGNHPILRTVPERGADRHASGRYSQFAIPAVNIPVSSHHHQLKNLNLRADLVLEFCFADGMITKPLRQDGALNLILVGFQLQVSRGPFQSMQI